MAKSLQSTLGKVSLCETLPLPHSKDEAHPSSKDKAKLMDYQGYDTSDESDKARVKPELHRQGSRMSSQCVGSDIYSRAMSSDNYSAFSGNLDMSSKKRQNPDDDVSQCSGAFSSEEGDDSDVISAQRLAGSEERPRADARRIFMQLLDQKRIEGCLPEFDDNQRTALGRVFLDALEMLGLNQANNGRRTSQNTTGNPRKRQRISPPESCERAPNSTDLTPAPTTPALAPAPIPVEVPLSVRNPVNFQHPTFTPPEVQNQLLPQIPSSVPQSFMPSADNLWLLQQQQQPQQQLQQQQEAENDRSLLPMGDLDYINSWTGYDGLPEFGTRGY
ncbi:unnamed protein product [Alternaria alternata]